MGEEQLWLEKRIFFLSKIETENEHQNACVFLCVPLKCRLKRVSKRHMHMVYYYCYCVD